MVVNQEDFHKMMGAGQVLELTLSLDAGNVYAAGDVLAATQELANVDMGLGVCGVIQSVLALDVDDQGKEFDLVVLNTNVSIGTENAAVSISDANAAYIVGVVSIESADYVDLGGSQIAHKENLGIQFKCALGDTSLYVAAISRGTGTYSASGIQLKIAVWYGL